MDKTVELNITDLAFDGRAVAKMNGKIVFLNAGLPGEIVRARMVRSKKNFNEAVVLDILTKSEERIEPICSHFAYCGGCSWQDLKYSKQLEIKKNHVSSCIERIGGLENVTISDVMPSDNIFGYRNKMEFSFNVHPELGFTLGLHKRKSYADIFDLTECHLPADIFARIVGWFREYVRRNQIAVYDVDRHGGFMRFLVIRKTQNTNDLMVNIVTNYGQLPDSEKLVSEMTTAFPEITTIVHNQNGQKSNIAVGEKEIVLFGSGFITEKVMQKSFHIRANSFFQTNSLQAEKLYETAFEMLQPEKTDRALDLYCGTGTISICASGMVSEVIGVEQVADSIAMANENAVLNNCTNVSFVESDVKDYMLETNNKKFNIVITDPPRSGMHPKVLKRLIEMKPEKILYISCNPSTFARDAKELADSGYSLPQVKPVDMFPHTRHIELAAVFLKNSTNPD
ncbi:MAG TPA: 23S rRNA (uracil(1939)-C(5))-methyltransferase RlmD [candidate division Zixibacteria bacterium]|nr:23S rRNA (uracil(1939)-C(5))-methyltransferase RlmD [candidate division Zixibacteria bacterium]